MTDYRNTIQNLQKRFWVQAEDRENNRRVSKLAQDVELHAPQTAGARPVIFFRASTGLRHLSLNSAFPLVASYALRLAGAPVVHFACRAGMSRCVQGTDKKDYTAAPPCRECIATSQRWLAHSSVAEFTYTEDKALAGALTGLDLPGMESFEYEGIPLGRLTLPSLRWILRRHHLPDDEPTRALLRQYILSAYRLAGQFSDLVDRLEPQAVAVFNGMFFPEATARWVARQKQVRAISHEVGFRPFSAFFTDGDATAYPIDIPPDFQLNDEQNARLDAYLEQRFKGNFTMAGIRFWPEMRGLDQALQDRISSFKQVVPVFTNVIFDTSQVHANTVFEHMFAWLEQVVEIARAHPDTLFVIRAHPDEMRPTKRSRESVHDWVMERRANELPNVLFIDSLEFVSSYELIQRSKFVMVYNSSIGLEASLMGAAVLCAGRARFTQIPTVFFPDTPAAHRQQAEAFLQAERVNIPPEFRQNARRFLYYHLYRASLPFDAFLEENKALPGFVKLRQFSWQALLPCASPVLDTIVCGLLEGRSFLLDEK